MADYRYSRDEDAANRALKLADILSSSIRNKHSLDAETMQKDAAQQHELAKLSAQEAQGQRETDRNLSTAKALVEQDPALHVALSGTGGVNLNRPNLAGVQQRQQQVGIKNLEGLGRRVEAAKLPEQASLLQGASQDLPPAGEEFKSAGKFLNYVPNVGVKAGEALGILPKGASQERASIEALKALVRNPIFGASLSDSEKRSFETGFGPGASEEDLRQSVARMGNMMRSRLQTIEQSSDPGALSEFRKQGGISSDELNKVISHVAGSKPKAGIEQLLKPASTQPSANMSPREKLEWFRQNRGK
jgi:hypothetical protein